MVPLEATRTEFYVATIATFIYSYYNDLEETLNHLNIIKLRNYLGKNVTYLGAAILVDDEHLEITKYFKPEHC